MNPRNIHGQAHNRGRELLETPIGGERHTAPIPREPMQFKPKPLPSVQPPPQEQAQIPQQPRTRMGGQDLAPRGGAMQQKPRFAELERTPRTIQPSFGNTQTNQAEPRVNPIQPYTPPIAKSNPYGIDPNNMDEFDMMWVQELEYMGNYLDEYERMNPRYLPKAYMEAMEQYSPMSYQAGKQAWQEEQQAKKLLEQETGSSNIFKQALEQKLANDINTLGLDDPSVIENLQKLEEINKGKNPMEVLRGATDPTTQNTGGDTGNVWGYNNKDDFRTQLIVDSGAIDPETGAIIDPQAVKELEQMDDVDIAYEMAKKQEGGQVQRKSFFDTLEQRDPLKMAGWLPNNIIDDAVSYPADWGLMGGDAQERMRKILVASQMQPLERGVMGRAVLGGVLGQELDPQIESAFQNYLIKNNLNK